MGCSSMKGARLPWRAGHIDRESRAGRRGDGDPVTPGADPGGREGA
jgi:hypothetical protein